MIYQLKRKITNSTAIWSLLACVFFIALVIFYFITAPHPQSILIAEGLFVPLLVAFAIKRFLIEVEFDFTTKTLTTRSTIPFIRNTYNFNRIDTIKTVAISRGSIKTINGVELGNFVIRITGKLQPQIYTIKTLEENDTVIRIINQWNKGLQ